MLHRASCRVVSGFLAGGVMMDTDGIGQATCLKDAAGVRQPIVAHH